MATSTLELLLVHSALLNAPPAPAAPLTASLAWACPVGCSKCINATYCQTCQNSPTQYYLMSSTNLCYNPCPATYYASTQNKTCQACNSLCATCSGSPANCQSCVTGYFIYNSFCYSSCPIDAYQTSASSCAACDTSCKTCLSATATGCLSCFLGSFLVPYNSSVAYGACKTCANSYTPQLLYLPSYISSPQSIADCRDICGDGRRVTTDVQCDDGNNISGDGCSATCQIEGGWSCSGGSQTSADKCTDVSGITVRATTNDATTYFYNQDSNMPYVFQLTFSKTPIFPSQSTLSNFIVITVLETGVSVPFTVSAQSVPTSLLMRTLQSSNQTTNYVVSAYIPETISDKHLQVTFKNTQQITAANGGTLQSMQISLPVNAYLYIPDSERERSNTYANASWWLAIVVLAFVLPLVYRWEYFRVGITIECMQYMYFLMFLNVNFSPTLMNFFQGLHPFVSLFVPNPFYGLTSTSSANQIGLKSSFGPSAKFQQSSSEVNQNFVDNFGGVALVLAGVFFVHFVLSAIVRLKILSEEKTEKLRVFVELYFKWGVHIDFVQLTFFLIVTFALIQIATLELYAQAIFAYVFGGFSIFFFIFSIYVNVAYRKRLYIPPDPYEEVPLAEYMEQESYVYKQLWQGLNMEKPYAYCYYSLKFFRNFLFAVILVFVTNFIAQIAILCGFNLFVAILLIWRRPYAERRDNARAIISELLLLTGTSLLSLQQIGSIENETTRTNNSWYSIYFFFASLVVQVVLLLTEIFFPYLLIIYYRLTYEEREVKVFSTREPTKSNGMLTTGAPSIFNRAQSPLANQFQASQGDSKWQSPLQSYHDQDQASQNALKTQEFRIRQMSPQTENEPHSALKSSVGFASNNVRIPTTLTASNNEYSVQNQRLVTQENKQSIVKSTPPVEADPQAQPKRRMRLRATPKQTSEEDLQGDGESEI